MKSLADINFIDKNLVIRVDMNVPMIGKQIKDLSRIKACLPTINFALENGCRILLISHLGRPSEGEPTDEHSLRPICNCLSDILNEKVELVQDISNKEIFTTGSRVKVLENIRFFVGEKSNSLELGKTLGTLGDIYVFDAFGTSHREQASTHSAILQSKECCAGLLLEKEIKSLNKSLNNALSPYLAIIGGAKVSSKLGLINNLNDKADHVIVGGGIANTFLKAAGFEIGKSLFEDSMLEIATEILSKEKILLPSTVVVSQTFEGEQVLIKRVEEVSSTEMILDQRLTNEMKEVIRRSKLILWNGPLGVFENSLFCEGTRDLASKIALSKGFSIAGGGETLSAINTFINKDDVSYCSTGGGAFLEFMEGKKLPSIEALERK